MSSLRRYIPNGERSVVETTNRTVQSRFLFRPRPQLNDIVVGALARAQERYDVDIHGYVFLSNHYHLLSSVYSAQQLSAFTGYFQSKIAKEVCRLYDWSDKVWARRFRSIVAFDEDAQLERFRYLLENGCKEGLVSSPLEWPGAQSAKALTEGKREVEGVWIDRTRFWSANQRQQEASIEEFTEREVLQLSPLPALAHLSEDRYTEFVGELVEEIEKETKARHEEAETKPLGVEEVQRQDPHRRPVQTKREPAPLVHATTKAARIAFKKAYNAFVAACLAATDQLRRTGDASGFPEGAFLPPLPVAVFDSS